MRGGSNEEGGLSPAAGGDRPAGEPDDLRHALALASLPKMTPQRLRRVLAGRPAVEVWEEVARSAPRIRRALSEMRSHANGAQVAGEPRRGRGEPPGIEEVLAGWSRHARRLHVEALYASTTARGIEVFRRGGPGYPWRLLGDDEAPEVLFAHGDLGAARGPTVAVVGTRRATGYGIEVASELGADLARAGVCVVSGLAAGIDAAAHEGALASLGGEAGPKVAAPEGDGGRASGTARPVGVLAGGVDVDYPLRNRGLIGRVRAAGEVVSEAPPGARAETWRFPLRNRIIAGLSQVVVIVEAGLSGWAIQTVTAAGRRGREVLAVPGSVRSPSSAGTNELLARGCRPARDAHDVLAAVERACRAEGIPGPGRPPGSDRDVAPAGPPAAAERRLDGESARRLEGCSPATRAVHAALGVQPVPAGSLCSSTGLRADAVALALDELLELGLAEAAGDGWRRR
ncbi:MAG TPA: DNA-processing protein DprA [Acidimicrobiales bacterium]|nr:DNA-processing protein DprA [Acidimicrobiales bacterium]